MPQSLDVFKSSGKRAETARCAPLALAAIAAYKKPAKPCWCRVSPRCISDLNSLSVGGARGSGRASPTVGCAPRCGGGFRRLRPWSKGAGASWRRAPSWRSEGIHDGGRADFRRRLEPTAIQKVVEIKPERRSRGCEPPQPLLVKLRPLNYKRRPLTSMPPAPNKRFACLRQGLAASFLR